jgi:hypothetical protein
MAPLRSAIGYNQLPFQGDFNAKRLNHETSNPTQSKQSTNVGLQ